MKGRELHWTINGKNVEIRIEESKDGGTIYIDSQPTVFGLLERTAHRAVLEVDGQTHRVFMASDRNGCTVWWNGQTFRIERGQRSDPDNVSHATAEMGEVHAAMPGKILRIDVEVGAEVKEGQPLLAMESMKMETTVFAMKSGRAIDVRVQPGQVVDVGELLLKID